MHVSRCLAGDAQGADNAQFSDSPWSYRKSGTRITGARQHRCTGAKRIATAIREPRWHGRGCGLAQRSAYDFVRHCLLELLPLLFLIPTLLCFFFLSYTFSPLLCSLPLVYFRPTSGNVTFKGLCSAHVYLCLFVYLFFSYFLFLISLFFYCLISLAGLGSKAYVRSVILNAQKDWPQIQRLR